MLPRSEIAGLGPIMQIAYIVEDLTSAIECWASNCGVGPFVRFDHLQCKLLEIDDRPAICDFSLALANSGDVQIELIQQHDNTPTVYLDAKRRPTPGVNHLGICTSDLEADEARLIATGHRRVQRAIFNSGVEVRYYAGAPAGLIELIQGTDELYAQIKQAALDWDGVTPVAQLGPRPFTKGKV